MPTSLQTPTREKDSQSDGLPPTLLLDFRKWCRLLREQLGFETLSY